MDVEAKVNAIAEGKWNDLKDKLRQTPKRVIGLLGKISVLNLFGKEASARRPGKQLFEDLNEATDGSLSPNSEALQIIHLMTAVDVRTGNIGKHVQAKIEPLDRNIDRVGAYTWFMKFGDDTAKTQAGDPVTVPMEEFGLLVAGKSAIRVRNVQLRSRFDVATNHGRPDATTEIFVDGVDPSQPDDANNPSNVRYSFRVNHTGKLIETFSRGIGLEDYIKHGIAVDPKVAMNNVDTILVNIDQSARYTEASSGVY